MKKLKPPELKSLGRKIGLPETQLDNEPYRLRDKIKKFTVKNYDFTAVIKSGHVQTNPKSEMDLLDETDSELKVFLKKFRLTL